MTRNVEIFLSGIVAIGLVTALVLNGRQTAQVIKAGGSAGQGLLGTAIKG